MATKGISEFKRGDRVQLIRGCRDFRFGDTVFETGETGTLGELYRVQDGHEVWQLALDKKRPFVALGIDIQIRIAVSHKDLALLPKEYSHDG